MGEEEAYEPAAAGNSNVIGIAACYERRAHAHSAYAEK